MNRSRIKFLRERLVQGALLTLLGFAIGCNDPAEHVVQGYIEGEFLHVASPFAGRLVNLAVQRGSEVQAGDLLFVLESEPQHTSVEQAQRRLAQARAALADAQKGQRPSEIEAIEAMIREAEAALEFSTQELARQEKLIDVTGATTEQDLQRARSRREQDLQRVAQLQAELQTARLGARPDRIAAEEANVRALEAALAHAEWELSQKSQTAPGAGRVFDVFYQEGEWVAAGRPVVSLLPPGAVKLRAYVPQRWLGAIRVGDVVNVSVDGASAPFNARITFISPEAEFTPPVIYNRENRDKFVFLIEALFEPQTAVQLHPGQPVDVRFQLSQTP